MAIGRFLGWFLLFAAGTVIVRDAIAWADIARFAPLSLGGLWSDLGAASFRSARNAIDHRMPWLWTGAMRPLLLLWAAPVFAVCGFLLSWSCRRTRQRRFR